MVLMQSAEADLNWSRLLAEATEGGSYCSRKERVGEGKHVTLYLPAFVRIAS